MGIERLDDHDAPAVGEHSADNLIGGQPTGDLPAVAPETRDRTTYQAEYRATVDAEYLAAHESWDAALPELRRAWEAHETRWPAPERSGRPLQPDTLGAPGAPGAWRGDGGRYLDPEATAEVDRGCDRIREVGENVIVPGMRHIEAEDPDRRLIGLEYHLKGPERIKDKVADAVLHKGRTPEEAMENLKDAIRFTFVYSEERYTSGVYADCGRLRDRGFQPFDLVNSWRAEEYKGINTRWREPESGLLFEVQFHTRASFEAKQLTHAAYERLRNPLTSDNERGELQAYQRMVCTEIPISPGATEIEDYSPEKRDG